MIKKEKLNIQLFEFPQPIPSLTLHSLKFKEGKWWYVYPIYTAKRLTDKKLKESLYLSSNMENPEFVSSVNKNLTMVEVFCKNDVIKLFKKQRANDLLFRKEFKEKASKEFLDSLTENTITLKNKNQKASNLKIVKIKKKSEKETVFVGREL